MSIDRCVCCGDYVPEGSMVCVNCIQKASNPEHKRNTTSEFQKIIHANWIMKKHLFMCSNCHHYQYHKSQYCGNCGALMNLMS